MGRTKGLIGWVVAVCLVAIVVGSITVATVQAPVNSPPVSSPPIPMSQYGVVIVSGTEGFSTPSGLVTIELNSNGYGAFFVVKLLIFLNPSGQTDLLLDTIILNGYTYSFTQYYGAPKVIVVPSGNEIGDVITALSISLPTQLFNLLVMKDPMDNQAIVLSGATDTGLTIKLRPAQGGPGGFGYITAAAVVTAPSNNTISISMS